MRDKMKKAFFLLAALLLLTGCGEGSGKKLRIGISIPAATHGWTGGVVWSAEQAKKNLEAANPDLQVIVTSSANTADQVNRIENLVARNVDALVVLAQEPGPITDICARAREQGIFLVVVSNPLDKPVQDVFVNGDNRSSAAAAAKSHGAAARRKGRNPDDGGESPARSTKTVSNLSARFSPRNSPEQDSGIAGFMVEYGKRPRLWRISSRSIRKSMLSGGG